jgi:hypothetical protein
MWLLGAGAGALLGFALTGLFPNLSDGTMGLVVIVGLAILLGVLAFFGKAFAKVIAMGVGFVIGGSVALNFADMLALGNSWFLALVTGAVVAVLFVRFLDWALIIFASLLGSMLIVRGGMVGFPELLAGSVGTVIVVVLTLLGITFHYRKRRPDVPVKPVPPPAAA